MMTIGANKLGGKRKRADEHGTSTNGDYLKAGVLPFLHYEAQKGSGKGEESKRNDTGAGEEEDDEHHMLVNDGDVLANRFTVLKRLGVGTFGKVYRCKDAKHSDEVAVKVIRKVDRYKSSAKVEAKILKQLYFMQEDNLWQPNVIMYTHFEHLGHYCMVFEPLGKSLLQYVHEASFFLLLYKIV